MSPQIQARTISPSMTNRVISPSMANRMVGAQPMAGAMVSPFQMQLANLQQFQNMQFAMGMQTPFVYNPYFQQGMPMYTTMAAFNGPITQTQSTPIQQPLTSGFQYFSTSDAQSSHTYPTTPSMTQVVGQQQFFMSQGQNQNQASASSETPQGDLADAASHKSSQNHSGLDSVSECLQQEVESPQSAMQDDNPQSSKKHKTND